MAIWPNGSASIPTVTGEFGPRTPIWTPDGWTGNFHYGIDMVWSSRVIYAPVAGVVVLASYNGGAGLEVRIQRPNGDRVRLFHNSRIDVSVGQHVYEGQPVAIMGTTGQSTGVHCHMETHRNGAAMNPRVYIAENQSGGGSAPIKKKEDEDMPKNSGVYYKRANDGADVFVVANTGSGFYSERTGILGDRDYQLRLVAAFDLSGAGFFLVSEGDAAVIREACLKVRESHRPA